MRIIKIFGGLGNQMFQGALALALHKQNKSEVYLDISHFEQFQTHQGFELQRLFALDLPIASDTQLKSVLGWKHSKVGQNIMERKRLSFLRSTNYYKEDCSPFSEDVFRLNDPCYIVGFWQNERYFSHIEHVIRDKFRFDPPLTGKNTQLASLASDGIPVSLHVRRGDYVGNSAFHGLLGRSFYLRAMKYIEQQLTNPTYFVFSDDLDWVRSNIPIDKEHHFISHNQGEDSFYDLWLMSLCEHHIIANSSFSWWGSWLNPSPDKMVLAPKKWFTDPKMCDVDPIPKSWIKIDT
jgi:hypothetical protein